MRPASCGRAVEKCSPLHEQKTRRSSAGPKDVVEALAATRCARPRASPTARPASCSPIRWRSAHVASGRSSCAGCRRASCRVARSPSRSSTTVPGPPSRSPPGSCSAATRPRCRASARSSTRVSAPGGGAVPGFRSSDEEGGPQQPSPFLDDVRALFTDELWEERGRRLLAEITWKPGGADTARAAPRPGRGRRRPTAGAAGAPADPAVLHCSPPATASPRAGWRRSRLPGQVAVETSEARSGRPGPRGDAQGLARPRGTRGDAEAPAGAHRLRAAGAGDAPGGARGAAGGDRRALRHATHDPREGRRPRARGRPRALSPPRGDDRRRLRARAARVELRLADDRRRRGQRARRPRGPRRPPRDRPRLQGPHRPPRARWAEDGRIQAALYAIAVREQLGYDVVGALYQPIGTADQRPRGVVRDDVPGRYVNGDVSDDLTLEERLEASREIAAKAAADLRAGRITPCPDRCAYNGGCAHPGICRAG